MCYHAEQRLEREPQSIWRARGSLRAWFTSWGVTADDPASALLDDALLVLSELLTNAVKYSAGNVEIVVDAHGDHVRVAVRDSNPTLARSHRTEATPTGGRGLTIVEAVSQSWGQDPLDEGKVVWSRLAVPSGSQLGAACRQPG